jgi:hypothetical protein
MSSRYARMSRDLYQEGLIHISSLTPATVAAPVPGRAIDQSDTSQAHRDVHELGQLGNAIACKFDQVRFSPWFLFNPGNAGHQC